MLNPEVNLIIIMLACNVCAFTLPPWPCVCHLSKKEKKKKKTHDLLSSRMIAWNCFVGGRITPSNQITRIPPVCE